MENEKETEREKLLREALESIQQKNNEYGGTRYWSSILVFFLIAFLAALLLFIILFSILN